MLEFRTLVSRLKTQVPTAAANILTLLISFHSYYFQFRALVEHVVAIYRQRKNVAFPHSISRNYKNARNLILHNSLAADFDGFTYGEKSERNELFHLKSFKNVKPGVPQLRIYLNVLTHRKH